MSIVVAGLALAAVAMLMGGGSSTRPESPGGGSVSGKALANKKHLYAQLLALPMLTEDQRLFLIYLAQGESRYNPLAFNDDPGERDAALEAFDNNASKFASCGYTREQLGRGSGGRFGRLLPYFVLDLKSVVPCIDPAAINDGIHDIVSAIHLARVFQDRDDWDGTVGSLRAGWRTPGDLSPSEDRLAKMRETAIDAGLGAEFISRKLTKFTDDLRGVLDTLIATAQVA